MLVIMGRLISPRFQEIRQLPLIEPEYKAAGYSKKCFLVQAHTSFCHSLKPGPPLTRVYPESLAHQNTSHQHPPHACSHSAPRALQHSSTGRTSSSHTVSCPVRCSCFQGQMPWPTQLPGPGHSPAADTPPRPLPGSRSHRTQCLRSRCARPPPALSTRCLLP